MTWVSTVILCVDLILGALTFMLVRRIMNYKKEEKPDDNAVRN